MCVRTYVAVVSKQEGFETTHFKDLNPGFLVLSF